MLLHAIDVIYLLPSLRVLVLPVVKFVRREMRGLFSDRDFARAFFLSFLCCFEQLLLPMSVDKSVNVARAFLLHLGSHIKLFLRVRRM